MARHVALLRLLAICLWLAPHAHSLAVEDQQHMHNTSAASNNLRHGAQGPEVDVQIFYKTDCPHCGEFIRRAVSELIDARLPGDRVKITIVPMVKPPNGQQECNRDSLCSSVLPLLCAWRPLVPQPVAADNPLFPSTMKFLSCDLMFSGTRGTGAVRECARRAGLDVDELDRCASGEKVVETIRTADFGGQIVGAIHRLQKEGFTDNVAMPWVFMGSTFLQCSGDGCTGTMHPDGSRQLEDPGSLLHLVCARLDPKPAACTNVKGYGPRPLAANIKACENCDEVVSTLRWQSMKSGAKMQMSWFVPATSMLTAGIVARCAWNGWRRRQTSLGMDFMPLEMSDPED